MEKAGIPPLFPRAWALFPRAWDKTNRVLEQAQLMKFSGASDGGDKF
jgi:hypothetical protein